MPVVPAVLHNVDTDTDADVLFNPTEYMVSKGNTFAESAVPGLGAPLVQFVHGNVRTLDLELFFDTQEEHSREGRTLNPAGGDVRKLLQPVLDLLEINPETHAPPLMQFIWGEWTFEGVVTSAQQRFLMFRETGVPVRARLQLAMTEVKDPVQEAKEVKRQTADYTRVEEVLAGDTLAAVAARRYADPARWRVLAIANELDDPRRLTPGTLLRVPPLPYRDPASGRTFR